MRDTGVRGIAHRIVSLRQPHVRCVMRGKAGTPCGFGQKMRLSVVNGFTWIGEQPHDNFNEGTRLKQAERRYLERMGHGPEAIPADTIHLSRENRKFCGEHGIRPPGPRPGRPRKAETGEDKAQAYRDSVDRSGVESRYGIARRRYGLDRIMAYLAQTGRTEAAMQILAMDVAHLPRFLFCLLSRTQAGWIRREKSCRQWDLRLETDDLLFSVAPNILPAVLCNLCYARFAPPSVLGSMPNRILKLLPYSAPFQHLRNEQQTVRAHKKEPILR